MAHAYSIHRRERGFTLIEMMITLVIMAMLGLMSWRGLDGLIRGKERIDEYNSQQREINYALTLLDRDCNAMLSPETFGTPVVTINNQGAWWIRSLGISEKPGWQMVGYHVNEDGLHRLISGPFVNRESALEAWQIFLKDSTKLPTQLDSQSLSAAIRRQDVLVLSDAPGATTPVKALKFVWQVVVNDPTADRALTRVCLAGGV